MAAPFQNFGITPGVQAEAPKRPHLYIGNLSPRVNDQMLTEIFAVAGSVVSAKIVQDRNYQHGGFNYGFVEYADMRSAEQALATLNGRKIFDAEVRVNWAYQGQQNREDTQHHYHVFVGDLSPEVNDEVLGKAFGAFGTMSEARVMWDMNSGKSRGYGFLSFREKADAEQAIATMNGEWLGSRAIRVNWANQKTQTGGGGVPGMPMGMGQLGGRPAGMGGGYASPMGGQSAGMQGQGSMGGMHAGISPVPSHQYASNPVSYEAIAAQTPDFNATVYVGNLIPYTTQADLIPLFQGYGYIVEIRMQADRGFAFVKLDSHHNAAMAITHLQNQPVHGRPIKCSWGKDKGPEGGSQGGNTPVSGSGQPGGQSPYPMQQQWGSNPQYGYYGGYAYGQTGVPGQPGSHVHQSGHHDQNGHAGQWDSAAAQAFYQSGGGWGNYYAQGDGSAQSGSANH